MQQHSITLDDITLNVQDTGGGGPSVVLIHPWPMTLAACKPQISALMAAGYRVISYDRRGFGDSEKPAAGYDWDSFATDLVKLIVSLRLTGATLVGIGMGCGEIVQFFSRFGGAIVDKAVLISTFTPFVLKGFGNRDGWLPLDEQEAMRQALEDDRNAFFVDLVTRYYSVNGELKITDQQFSEAIRMCKFSDPTAAVECFERFCSRDFRRQLADINKPTLIIHGDSDAFSPCPNTATLTQELIPGSQLVVLEGAPHGCNLTHADEVNALLLDFISR